MLRALGGSASHPGEKRSWRLRPVRPHDDPMMHEFIVEITTTVPERTDPAEVDARRAAEAVRAKELASSGNLIRLWRPVGELRSIGVWSADDETDLRERVLDTLPLRPWMELTITAVQPHPNDPGWSSPDQGLVRRPAVTRCVGPRWFCRCAAAAACAGCSPARSRLCGRSSPGTGRWCGVGGWRVRF